MEQSTKNSLARAGRIVGGASAVIGGLMLFTSDSMRPDMKKQGIKLALIHIVGGLILLGAARYWESTNTIDSKQKITT